MSITGSLFIAGGALQAYGDSMSVVGHNVANVNTVGFKASRAEFADLIPNVEEGVEIGKGVRLAGVSHPFRQGAIQATDNTTDLAIGGAGFFVVKDTSGNSFYTRAGQFHFDQDSNLVSPERLILQGSSGDIILDKEAAVPPESTTTLSLVLNLDPSASAPSTALPADAMGTEASPSAWFSAGNFSTVVSIFDSLGTAHDLIFLFRKSATANEWDYRVAANGDEVSGGTAGQLQQVSAAGGKVAFNSDGTLNSDAPTNITQIGAINWSNDADSQTIAAADVKFTDSTQFSQPSALLSVQKNGSPGGTLTKIAIDSHGNIIGRFSNGDAKVLDRIALANFPNVDGLEVVGGSLLAESPDSGGALSGFPAESGLGSVLSGAVEMSTVDLAQEFVAMITAQRSFQVNSRVITVADRMYEEAANLKR